MTVFNVEMATGLCISSGAPSTLAGLPCLAKRRSRVVDSLGR